MTSFEWTSSSRDMRISLISPKCVFFWSKLQAWCDRDITMYMGFNGKKNKQHVLLNFRYGSNQSRKQTSLRSLFMIHQSTKQVNVVEHSQPPVTQLTLSCGWLYLQISLRVIGSWGVWPCFASWTLKMGLVSTKNNFHHIYEEKEQTRVKINYKVEFNIERNIKRSTEIN